MLQACSGQGIPTNEINALMMRHENENLPLMAQTVAMGIRPEDLSKVSDLCAPELDAYHFEIMNPQASDTDAQFQGWFHGSVQNGKDVWLCVHCGGTFGEKGNLARHVRIVHDKVECIHNLAICISPPMAINGL